MTPANPKRPNQPIGLTSPPPQPRMNRNQRITMNNLQQNIAQGERINASDRRFLKQYGQNPYGGQRQPSQPPQRMGQPLQPPAQQQPGYQPLGQLPNFPGWKPSNIPQGNIDPGFNAPGSQSGFPFPGNPPTPYPPPYQPQPGDYWNGGSPIQPSNSPMGGGPGLSPNSNNMWAGGTPNFNENSGQTFYGSQNFQPPASFFNRNGPYRA